ncbi:MAG TPA: DUF1924 domain-containing protein [Candidatus Sulfotelmatobacter sp.]|jgi:hypothetical protein|nr:DUF1924 domain-containing protein [Candidatus Sulfotelmatobacter sp.]
MILRRLFPAAMLCLAAMPALAGDPARDALLADYAVQAKQADASFPGFSADRGKLLYTTRHADAKPETSSCSSCHGDDPAKAGQNAKTGKVIEPMAVSANPKRFTSKDDVEKWFGRNCKEVLGHDCSALEKGDYITFLATR